MKTLAIDTLVETLCEIPAEEFTVGGIYDLLQANPVCLDSLQPYIFFSKNCYTRNLVFKNEMFELMTLCWNKDQASLIHNHSDQNCWMSMVSGKLLVQNYRLVEQNEETKYCLLESTDAVELDKYFSAGVDPEEPIHQVLNLAEFDQQAISLHIYSRPFDRCMVYSTVKNEMWERQLCYTSEYGQLCEGARL